MKFKVTRFMPNDKTIGFIGQCNGDLTVNIAEDEKIESCDIAIYYIPIFKNDKSTWVNIPAIKKRTPEGKMTREIDFYIYRFGVLMPQIKKIIEAGVSEYIKEQQLYL